MDNQLNNIQQQGESAIKQASSLDQLHQVKNKFLGRNSQLQQIIKKIPNLNHKKKKHIGQLSNQIKNQLQNQLEHRQHQLSHQQVDTDFFDHTQPVVLPNTGHLHPITTTINQIEDIFKHFGFTIASGPEIEWDQINFQKLRLGPNHPSRDTQETYYFDKKRLLRVHTSSVQIRHMEQHQPPIRIISPGRVYRRDTIDNTHLPSFFQLEGLMVDKKTQLTDLLGMLQYLAKQLFGQQQPVRFYGHNFPYTEPSLEIEVQDKQGQWLEILGCGFIHPEVLENCQIDSNKYQGWAFGLGIDRIAMLKHNITDIRQLYSGNLQFLNYAYS